VFMLTRPGLDISIDGAELFAVRITLTAALSELSYRVVESPIRHGAAGRAWQSLKHLRRPSMWPSGLRPLGVGSAACAGIVFLGITVASASSPVPPSYLAVPAVNIVSWSQPGGHTPTPRPTPPPVTGPSSAEAPLPPGQDVPALPPAAPETPPPSTAEPGLQPPPPLPSPPSRVFAVGDSVMLGAAPWLSEAIPNAEIDAAVSRQVSEGIAVLEARHAAGTLGDLVIVHLGTNGSFTSGQFDRIMEVLSGVQRVVFVNLRVPRDWEAGDNAIIAEGVQRHPNAVLADWHTVASARPEFFYDDSIHLNPDGATFYSQLIAAFTR
jgi:hypothetical protein